MTIDNPKLTAVNLPLSSLASVPCTPETRRALADAGLSCSNDMSELTAQSMLALRTKVHEDERPPCYGRQYEPSSTLCAGCLVSPSCWGDDSGYLRRLKSGKAAVPTGAPPEAVEERLRTYKPRARAKPPSRRKK
jgi:hypothetical protein